LAHLPEPPPLDAEQQRLVTSCVALARKVARDLHRLGGLYARVSVEDLEGAAYYGLCLAAQRFEPSRGLRFTTFATWYARGYAQKTVYTGGVITLPSTVTKGGRRGRSCSTRAASAAAVYARPIGGDSRDDDDAPGHRPACRRPGPAEEAERADYISHALSSLYPRERRVVEARVLEGRKLEEVAAELRLSRERVRQIEKRAMEKLRKRATPPAA
jgi:RNA polymerase sigma-32 factor